MLEKNGLVMTTQGEIAIVSFLRASACEGCHRHAQGCSACSLLGGDRRHVTKVRNKIGAREGDRVRVAASEGRLLAYAALVFLLPILLAFVFFAIGAAVDGSNSWFAGIMATCGFLLAMFLIIIFSAHVSKLPPDAEIIAVINDREDE